MINKKFGVTVEEAFEITRGNQWSQLFYGLSLGFIYSLTGNFVYALPFLGKYPEFEWRENSNLEWYKWLRSEVWGEHTTEFAYRYDESSIYTLNNWITSMSLEWAPEYKIGLFGSLYFIGYLIGSIGLTKFADEYGRKPVLLFALLVSTIAAFWFLITVFNVV